jgi:hypothetical protein
MLPFCAGVSRGGYDDNSLTDGFLGGLIDDAARTRDVLVSAQGDIQDANVKALAVLDYPLNAPRDIFFADASPRAGLNQD